MEQVTTIAPHAKQAKPAKVVSITGMRKEAHRREALGASYPDRLAAVLAMFDGAGTQPVQFNVTLGGA